MIETINPFTTQIDTGTAVLKLQETTAGKVLAPTLDDTVPLIIKLGTSTVLLYPQSD